jgi:hypothetical protein
MSKKSITALIYYRHELQNRIFIYVYIILKDAGVAQSV